MTSLSNLLWWPINLFTQFKRKSVVTCVISKRKLILRFQNKTKNNPCAYVSAQCESFEFNGISRYILVLLTIVNLN